MDMARAILAQANGGADKACRNLFGKIDHEQLKKDYENDMKKIIEEATQRWNFDFVNEIPLEGDYQWEKVDCPMACIPCGESRKRKQKLITDYYQVKRRRSSPKPACL